MILNARNNLCLSPLTLTATSTGQPMKDDSELQQLIDAECTRLNSESKAVQLARSAGYWAKRIAVRAMRILTGLALSAVALWCGSIVAAALGTPLAALTLGGIFLLIVAALGALVAGLAAIAAAFGEAPSRPDLRARADAAARQQLELAAEQERVAHWYRHGRLVGLLLDPTLAKRHTWLPWVSVIGAYVVLGLVVALVSHYSS